MIRQRVVIPTTAEIWSVRPPHQGPRSRRPAAHGHRWFIQLLRRIQILRWNRGRRSHRLAQPVSYSCFDDGWLRDVDLQRWNCGKALFRCCERATCDGHPVDYNYERGFKPSKRSAGVCVACYKRDGR